MGRWLLGGLVERGWGWVRGGLLFVACGDVLGCCEEESQWEKIVVVAILELLPAPLKEFVVELSRWPCWV